MDQRLPKEDAAGWRRVSWDTALVRRFRSAPLDVAFGSRTDIGRYFKQLPHNIRMHLTVYSGLRPLPPAGDAVRSASFASAGEDK